MSKLFQNLGLARRAGKIVTGETAMTAIKEQKAMLVLIASDAAERTKSRILEKCRFYCIRTKFVEDSVNLAQSIGKENCMFVAVLDEGFARIIENELA